MKNINIHEFLEKFNSEYDFYMKMVIMWPDLQKPLMRLIRFARIIQNLFQNLLSLEEILYQATEKQRRLCLP